jgi:hypothetical protein
MASARISTNTDASREWEDYCELGVAVTPLNLHEEGTLQNLSVADRLDYERDRADPLHSAKGVLIGLVLGSFILYGIYCIVRAL